MTSEWKMKQAAGMLRGVMARSGTNLREHEDNEREVLARYQPTFAPDAIPDLAEEDFRSFLRGENNRHWRTLHRSGPRICADMDRLREALSILVDESRPIEERLNKLLPKGEPPMVPYLGRAIITAILLVVAPERWGVWNNVSEASLKTLGVFPDLPKSAPFAERYVAFNRVLNELATEVGIDLWTLDVLHSAIAGGDEAKPTSSEDDEEAELLETEDSPVARFGLEQHLHDFMRDNWESIPLATEWALFEQDGDVVGYKYPTGQVGEIDLLAKHKTQPRWLVIELKRNQTSDATVGQVLRYLGWVEEHLATEGESVEGLIIAHGRDERIRYALKHTSGVSLRLYEIDFRLREPDQQRNST